MWKDATGAAFLKFERSFIRGIRPAELAGRKPASIGRLRAGGPETRVNSGLADRLPGNARKHWASGQPFRRCPFYAGFRTCPFAYHETAPADAWHNSRKTVDTCRTKIIPITFLDLLEASLGADWKNAGFVTLSLWRVFSRQELNKNHYFAPCHLEGKLQRGKTSCFWKIQASAIGKITCGGATTYFACDDETCY